MMSTETCAHIPSQTAISHTHTDVRMMAWTDQMANEDKGKETREALLQAARQLVSERGYANATVRELAAASGTNLSAVAYHFGSREALLNQAILDSFLEWSDRVGEAGPADPDAPALDQLAARARPMMAGLADAQPAFVICLEALVQSRHAPELHRQLVEHYAELRRRAGEFITESARGRELPPRMVEVFTSFMIAVADGLQLQALLDPAAVPTGEELAQIYEGMAASARASRPPSGRPE